MLAWGVFGGIALIGWLGSLAVRGQGLESADWLGDEDDLLAAARAQKPVLARVRSTRPPVLALLIAHKDDRIEVEFDGAEEGVAPGQACVLYDTADDGRVLGGGFIASTRAALAL